MAMSWRKKVRNFICVASAVLTLRKSSFHHHLFPAGDPTEPCDLSNLPPGLWTRDADLSGRMLIGTTFAQNYIYQLQHPSDCHSPDVKAAVLLYHAAENGIGSMIHLAGVGLAHALQQRRVFLFAPESFFWRNGPHCAGADSIDHCWFRPASSCNLRDFMHAPQVANLTNNDLSEWTPSYPLYNKTHDSAARIVNMDGSTLHWNNSPSLVPVVFHDLLRAACIPQHKWFYWWRAQAAAYFVRFTNPMLTMLHRHQLKIYPHDHLPRGVINVHVRRGDKITEAKLCTDEAFLQQVETLVRGGGSGGGSKLLRHIFLSTEDSLTMEFFKRTDFRISSTNVARTHRSDIKIVDLAAARGIDLELADSLVSLQYALQCDAFVGDLSSNWVRLIDELRSTVRCKAHMPFLDPSQTRGIQRLHW